MSRIKNRNKKPINLRYRGYRRSRCRAWYPRRRNFCKHLCNPLIRVENFQAMGLIAWKRQKWETTNLA